MKPYHVLKFPAKPLKQKCLPVPENKFGTRLSEIASRMSSTMREEDGIGLAANQVGMLIRMIVIETGGITGLAMVNPEILESSDEKPGQEGCLSFPGESAAVNRHQKVKVRFRSPHGETVEKEFEGQTAVCVQHEIDHLDGITMKDRENG